MYISIQCQLSVAGPSRSHGSGLQRHLSDCQCVTSEWNPPSGSSRGTLTHRWLFTGEKLKKKHEMSKVTQINYNI